MDIKESAYFGGLLISVPNETKMYRLSDNANIVIGLTEQEQRELLVWFARNKPTLVLDTICKECKEMEDYHNWCENKVERLK